MFELLAPTKQASARAIALSPAQRKAADGVIRSLERGEFAVVLDHGSDGKTTVLSHLHRELGGVCLGVRPFLSKLSASHPAAMEEAFLAVLDEAVAEHRLVIVDDLHLIQAISTSEDYPRKYLFEAAVTALLDSASAAGTKMVFASSAAPDVLQRRAHSWFIQDFTAEDYRAICGAYLQDPASRIDFTELHRFAPSLSAHQLRSAAEWLAADTGIDTARFCDYLASQHLVSNVDVEEVEAVTWDDLKGVDNVIDELETKVALPFEDRELAMELNLKPKRGVLLAGPPGTGKTTIGRALAHRLKGKFFLVDGTMIAGSHRFYCEIDRVFSQAERNAPSVVFIDDADVIFGGEKEPGLYRYLLTKLDGLESRGAGRICVMMTAMEPSDLPAAILRSGRVELWLETRLPDAPARAEIFRSRLASLPPPLCTVDVNVLAAASSGCTGADLKAAVDDGKLRFASHKSRGLPISAAEDYFLDAVAGVRENRRRYRRRKPPQVGEWTVYGYNTN